MRAPPVGILLAAGRSSRFGSHKLLHRLPDGVPIGLTSARGLRAVLARVVAVVRPDDAALAGVLREAGCEILPCARADAGMGASLACGVAHAADAAGWVVALADMPYVAGGTIKGVAAALREGASIAAPVLADGRRGHPVGFAAEWLDALTALGGDSGARELLRAYPERITPVRVGDAGCVVDVDCRADLA